MNISLELPNKTVVMKSTLDNPRIGIYGIIYIYSNNFIMNHDPEIGGWKIKKDYKSAFLDD